jgi:hypothetical protein
MTSNCRPLHYYHCFYEAKLCLRKLILLLFFSQDTPLHWSAASGRLEVVRLLVESKADVAARTRCFSPPPSHHLSLTICIAAGAELHSKRPLSRTKATLLHTCAASARLSDAPPRAAAAAIKAVLVRVAAAVRGGGEAPSRTYNRKWVINTSQSCCRRGDSQILNPPPFVRLRG